jgi:hypothetical protein
MPSTQEDIDALLERAAAYGRAAEQSSDPAQKRANLWLAASLRAKAEQLAKQPLKE